MEAHQYQAYEMDDTRYPSWMADQNTYMQPCRQQAMPFLFGEDPYFDEYSNVSTNAQPMQRFMDDAYPLCDSMLQVNIPLYSQYKWQTEQQLYQADCFRDPSPDRTSSSNTSQNTPDELSSPFACYDTPYISPMDCPQMSYSCLSMEQLQGISYQFETAVPPINCSLSQLEYTHAMSEMVENDDAVIKQEPVTDSMHGVVKKEETPELMVYSDSSIENSTRDAQSVEPVDLPEEHSSDSEYSPSCRSGKRRKSTASSGQTAKRRRHARKDSHASSTTGSAKVEKKARRTSKTPYYRNSESTHRADCLRPFPCPFASYGCKSDFSSKNEWKRHISTQHIKLSYWRCDLCPPSVDPNDEESFYHNDFNRKDLFTQHLRRMHAAPKDKEKGSHNHKEYPVNDDNLAEHQARCSHRLRSAPQFSSCLFCPRSFEGATSWDERIEHVGRHLEKDHAIIPDMLDPRTWFVDERLEVYLVEEGLIARDGCGWRIGDGNPCRGSGVVDSEDEE